MNAAVPSVALGRCRAAIGLFIVGVVLSGLSAFPLQSELGWLSGIVGPGGPLHTTAASFGDWIVRVRDGLAVAYRENPWIAYGTDWLGFSHVVVGLSFIGAWRDPVRNVTMLRAGFIACLLVIPFALIAGAVREVPLLWRLVDCALAVVGLIVLGYALSALRGVTATSAEL